ncbi:MAG: HIT domain-containing protein [Chloroflexi bacterium]|nr:HIT domain-containing protein [Chloroflexota bacterium]
MEFMWAPWRIEYILGEKDEDCIFCYKPKEDKDRENLLLFRGERNLVMLNKYPYNPGHIMVAPYKHVSSLDALDDEDLLEHFKLVSRCVEMMKEEMNPEGFNIGINLGKVAGAGIEEHIHTHIVPRWNGDTNFMPVFSDMRVVPEALEATYDKLVGKLT